jgi:uncharacterized protein (TIGR00288 family)
MNEVQSQFNRLAVLIDAENANPNLIESLLKEIAKYGNAHVKRIYGDWTNQYLSKWKEKLNKFAVHPIQQFQYTVGKNSTDNALIIDAMDLLYTKSFDGFCIVSSDSDFTRLASRIREDGLLVYGFGEKKTPESFVSACDKFIYTEILDQLDGANLEISDAISKGTKSAVNPTSASNQDLQKNLQKNQKLIKLLKDAYDAISDEEDEWIHLGPFGGQLTKLSPSFDSRNYGYKKLSELIQSISIFEIKKIDKSLCIRLKNQ